MKIWTKSYHDQIWDRINQRITSLKSQLDSIRVGRTMPDADDVRIGSGRYMFMAVMFIDICGFTKRDCSSLEGQKKVLIMLNLFISEMIAIIRDYGGVVEKNTGDGLMAYFGTERTDLKLIVGDAVSSSITMHYVTRFIINPKLHDLGIQPISFRIGIDFGAVTIARIGVHSLNTLTAVGSTANIACRLLELAGPNQTYLGNEVYDYLPQRFQEWCRPVWKDSGYIYVATKLPYPIWEYTGIWGYPFL